MPPREVENASRAADALRRLEYGSLALSRGVDGFMRVDLADRAGRLAPVNPTYGGPAWPLFCCEVAWVGDWAFPFAGLTPANLEGYMSARLILVHLIERLTAPEFHGAAWLRLNGTAGRLWYAHKQGDGYGIVPTLFPVARSACAV